MSFCIMSTYICPAQGRHYLLTFILEYYSRVTWSAVTKIGAYFPYLKWIFLVNEDLSNQVVLIINKNIQMLE